MFNLYVRLERVMLALLVVVTIAALAGYATFGLHPQWMGSSIGAMRAYAGAMTGFPRAHILLGAIALVVVLGRGAGMLWIIPALLLYVVSLSSELLGTTFGLPFGPYHYTDALGVKWLSQVPALIPLSWFTMSVSSFAIARRQLGARRGLTTVFLSALLLVAWDLALDPAMSRLAPYWVWGAPGPYFGMPMLNLAGWYVTGAALSGILMVTGAIQWVDALPQPAVTSVRWIYVANLAMPIGMTLAAGLAWAAAASLSVLGIAFGASLIRNVRIARIVRRRASRMEAL